MLANWIHVAIVHLVVLGTPWLTYRVLVHRNQSLEGQHWKRNYSGLIVVGILASLAYFTGPKAADWTKEVLDTYNQDLVENHALWGRVVFVIHIVTALLGVMGWASILQEETPHKRIPLVLSILLICNTLAVVYGAHLGGLIRRIDLMP